MKTKAQLTHSKTQTHGSNFDKCTHVRTKEMLQYYVFFGKFHIYGHAHLQIGNNGVMNMDININSILSMRSIAHFNTKISYNSILKRRNHEIATQQFCHVQLENSRPNDKIATQKMLWTT